jgi:hypothetical protein
MTKRQQNTPTVQYLVEGRLPGSGIAVQRFTIEQVETGSKVGTVDHPNYNSVQKHLSELSAKTGLDYCIVRWGDVMDNSEWVAGGPLRETRKC